MMDLTSDYLALRQDVGAVRLARDVLAVRGPDAVDYLQGQLSQDVASLPPGASAWSFLLQPQGKVDALLRVTRTDEDTLVLDVDAGWGEAVRARLERFKLRVKADLEPLRWECVALRGPGSLHVAVPPGAHAAAVAWSGLAGVDLLGERVEPPEGVRRCDRAAYEAVRIEAGWPAMGAEITERTIPAEAGVVDRTVSFTKGCYTGQELVARIDSRGGRVPRLLRGVLVATNIVPPVGAEVVVDDRVRGALTSVAESLVRRAPVALALVHRDLEPPAAGRLRWDDGGEAPARVESLPLVR